MLRLPSSSAERHSSKMSSNWTLPMNLRPLRQHLPQLGYRLVLYYLHVPFTLAHRPRRLRHRQPGREPQADDPPLSLRQRLRRLHDLVEGQPVRDHLLRALRVHRKRLRQRRRASARSLLPALADDRVVRDPEQPGGKRRFPPLEPLYRVQHPQEHLFGEVLGVVWVAHAGKDVTVHSGEIETVQLGQRRFITRLRGIDYSALAVSVQVRAHGAILPTQPPANGCTGGCPRMIPYFPVKW